MTYWQKCQELDARECLHDWCAFFCPFGRVAGAMMDTVTLTYLCNKFD